MDQTITVKATVELVADASATQTDWDVGATVTLDGSASLWATSWTWTVVNHSNLIGGVSTPPNGSGETFGFDLTEPDVIEYELTVSDGTRSDTDRVTIRSNPPTITSITPTSGAIGDKVTIDGTNFSPTASHLHNKVTFNGVEASFVDLSSASITQLEVYVPANATTGPVQVEVLGTGDKTTEAPQFTVTIPDPWTRWSSGAIDRDLYAVSFVDATHGWSVGSLGTILTTDGMTWSAQTSGTTEQLRGVDFHAANNGTAVGQNGTILRSDGATWTPVTIPGHTTLDYWSVSVFDQTGLAGGWQPGFGGGRAIIIYGSSGWSSWTADTIPTLFPRAVSLHDADTGWVVGNEGNAPAVYRTTAGAGNWQPATSIPDCLPLAVFFISSTEGWASGESSTADNCVMHSIDGGQNWTLQTLPGASSGGAVGVSFATDQVGTLIAGGRILRTEDGGANWFEETNPVSSGFNGVTMISTTAAVAVGNREAGEAVIIRRQ